MAAQNVHRVQRTGLDEPKRRLLSKRAAYLDALSRTLASLAPANAAGEAPLPYAFARLIGRMLAEAARRAEKHRSSKFRFAALFSSNR